MGEIKFGDLRTSDDLYVGTVLIGGIRETKGGCLLSRGLGMWALLLTAIDGGHIQ